VSRCYLFVPGDSARKFERALAGDADALILDLEDSVAPAHKAQAREATRAMLEQPRGAKQMLVRVNALDTGLTLADLAATMPARPDAIVLPKCGSPEDLRRLGHYLDAFEAAGGQAPGSTRIMAIATETAASLFRLGDYRGCCARLFAMMWGAEDLAASLGSNGNRDAGGYFEPFRLARNLCLAGAAAAGVEAVDTVFVDIENLDGLRQESLAARRDGFAGKAVIHPKHVEVVNAAFEPSADEVEWARRIVAAFEEGGSTGVARLDGRMIDQPHLSNAKRVLALAARRPARP
jgi:citrate lyase subunit beta/citryl-CoA lyase